MKCLTKVLLKTLQMLVRRYKQFSKNKKLYSYTIFCNALTNKRRKNLLIFKNMAANVKKSYHVPKETSFIKQISHVNGQIKWHPVKTKD